MHGERYTYLASPYVALLAPREPPQLYIVGVIIYMKSEVKMQ